ncbi:MAG: hypothetical protein ACJAVS_000112 [Paracoccaceae bacterium]|jgi:hypothetical protein
MIREIIRRSSSRATPRGLFGRSGFKRANWASDSQSWWSEIANSQHFAGAPHIAGRTGILFMGPEPSQISLRQTRGGSIRRYLASPGDRVGSTKKSAARSCRLAFQNSESHFLLWLIEWERGVSTSCRVNRQRL